MNEFRLFVALIAGLVAAIAVLPIGLFVLPFCFIHFMVKYLTKRFEPSHRPYEQIIEFDPLIGWKARPDLRTYHLADDVYQLTTDEDGWRGQTKISEADVVVFGDSFAFGHAIGDRAFFANLNPSLRVKAIGVDGYNLVQELLWMRRLGLQISNKLVVWFIFLGNDLFENLQVSMEGYRTPFVKQGSKRGEWEIVTNHVDRTPWPSGSRYYRNVFMKQLAGIFVAGAFSDRIFGACEYLIEEGKRTIREVGSELVVVSIPTKRQLSQQLAQELKGYALDPSAFDLELPDKRLAEICRRCGLSFVAGKDHLNSSHYRDFEVHWNEQGNRCIADLLADLYVKYSKAIPRKSIEAPDLAFT
jgi:hypothetical protein